MPTSGKRSPAAKSATKQLTALSPDKPQRPLSSDLTFDIKNAKPRSVGLSAGITPVYNAPNPDAGPSSLPRRPEPADPEEADETKVTPAPPENCRTSASQNNGPIWPSRQTRRLIFSRLMQTDQPATKRSLKHR